MTDRSHEGDVEDVRQVAETQASVPDDCSGSPWEMPSEGEHVVRHPADCRRER